MCFTLLTRKHSQSNRRSYHYRFEWRHVNKTTARLRTDTVIAPSSFQTFLPTLGEHVTCTLPQHHNHRNSTKTVPVSILPLISNPCPDPSGSCLPKSNASFHYMPHCICPRSLLTWHSYVIKFLHPPLQGVRRLLYRHRKPAALLSACLSVQVHPLLHSAECTGFSQALVIHSYRWVDFTLLRCLVLFMHKDVPTAKDQ